MNRHNDIHEHLAQIKFAIYLRYGFGDFRNWFSMQSDEVCRDEVVESLKFPNVKKAAQKKIEQCTQQIQEIREMIRDAESRSC